MSNWIPLPSPSPKKKSRDGYRSPRIVRPSCFEPWREFQRTGIPRNRRTGILTHERKGVGPDACSSPPAVERRSRATGPVTDGAGLAAWKKRPPGPVPHRAVRLRSRSPRRSGRNRKKGRHRGAFATARCHELQPSCIPGRSVSTPRNLRPGRGGWEVEEARHYRTNRNPPDRISKLCEKFLEWDHQDSRML